MAGIGLQYNVYSPLTEDEAAGTFSYGTGKRGRRMMKADVKINRTNSKLFSDDVESENVDEFTDGTITTTQDEFTDDMCVDLLGNTKTTVTVGEKSVEEVASKDTDNPPYVGYGYIKTVIVDKVRKYRAFFYTKVQFSEPDESSETKGQNISWQTPVIIGTIMRRVDGKWRERATCPDLPTAIAWLKDKANITP